MKVIFCIVYLLFDAVSNINAQSAIEINYKNDSTAFEFSGLAEWRDSLVFLITQKPGTHGNKLFCINSSEIACYVENCDGKKDTLRTTDIFLKNYSDAVGDLEAATIIGDKIFFAIENDDIKDFASIIAGDLVVSNEKIIIEIDTSKHISIPIPKMSKNMGFESLVYLKEKDSLLAVFEYNINTGNPTAYLLDTGLKGSTPVTFNSSLFFRLTDLTMMADSSIIGINQYYCDFKKCGKRRERGTCEYIKYEIDKNVSEARNQIRKFGSEIDPKEKSFTALIKLNYENGKLNWNPLKFISSYSPDCTENWEGILAFRSGVLMVVDGRPGEKKCTLKYYSLTN